MGSLRKFSSLEDKASVQVAINLCQENGFKEVALWLEKPTYGCFIPDQNSSFVSDPEKLSIWDTMEKNDWSTEAFAEYCNFSDIRKVPRWEDTIDGQCQRLTESLLLPRFLRQSIHAWINRIAWEYISYSQRQESLFGISRYFLMNIFIREDWKEGGRLDEERLAQRLLEDERLTFLQRYRIACVYCLHAHIPRLWKRLTQEEKRFTMGKVKRGLYEETHKLVLLWSREMNRDGEEILTKYNLWLHAAYGATYYGNRTALVSCWRMLKEPIPEQVVISMALESLQKWQSMAKRWYADDIYKECLIMQYCTIERYFQSIGDCNLPSYYSELMHFFLSQMKEKQQLTFFKKTFQPEYSLSVLKCFLDWPHQDYFLPTVNRLWGILPKDEYGKCLLALACKYGGNYEKENRYYDYRSLLGTLWEETPEDYKQYVFRDKIDDYSVINEGKVLLSWLLERSPFQMEDEALFEQVFRDQPQEKRREMVFSKKGENMCSNLIKKEKWSFVNWLLQECLPQEEIPKFKKQFIRSDCGIELCLDTLEENRERLADHLIDWCLEFDSDKTQCKDALIKSKDCLCACESFLRKGKFAAVERVINFCLSSDEEKEPFRALFAEHACSALLGDCKLRLDCMWKQMDGIVSWSVDTEVKIRDLKKHLFSKEWFYAHYRLVFIQQQWGEVERFYRWFGLSAEEIKKLKKDTVFSSLDIEGIYEGFYELGNTLVTSLRWCLTDEEMVIDLKNEVESYFTDYEVLNNIDEYERVLDSVSELLDGLRKEFQDKTNREGTFGKGTGRKRSATMIKCEFSSPRKRCK